MIYCAGRNLRFDTIAVEHGFKYGAQLPTQVNFPLYFADQNWKIPNRGKYMRAVEQHRPYIATVLDLEKEGQLSEVLDWVEEITQYVEQVIVIPKVCNIIPRIPHTINGKRVVLGYSVPTSHGATFVPIWEFAGWPIHLLGGSPQQQMWMWRYLSAIGQVVSTDGNMALKLATRRCQFWSNREVPHAHNKYWPMLKEIGIENLSDAPYEAFRRSCVNIRKAWDELLEKGQPP